MKTLFIALLFIWFGLVLGLSFIETPLKFMAPGISLELGLGIGRLVFATLSRIEIAFCVAGGLLLVGIRPSPRVVAGFALVVGIVALQALILLPALDQRVAMILAGGDPGPSHLHWFYIAAELLKLLALLVLGMGYTRARVAR